MKRFVLFGSPDSYYARGGWRDYLGEFSTADDAKAAGLRYENEPSVRYTPHDWDDDEHWPWVKLDWWHVVDTTEAKIVARSSSEPYTVRGGDIQFKDAP